MEFTGQIIILLRSKSSIINALFVFFVFQMPQESAHETNDATNSSAQGNKFVVYQEVNFVSEKHSLVLYTSMKLTIFLSHIFFFLLSGFFKLELINLE